MKKYAPIALFAFNRPEVLKNTIECLRKNYLARFSDLFIFVDGPRNEIDKNAISNIASIISTIDGFQSIHIKFSPYNRGLSNAIRHGISSVLEQYDNIIVLEDDIETTPNFLDYINSALYFYKEDVRIMSVCGYGLKLRKPLGYDNDFYLYRRSSSHGWGIWKDRWQSVDWQVKDWESFRFNIFQIITFCSCGSDMYGMLKDSLNGKNNSWAIRFCYSQFKQKRYSLIPFRSFVIERGQGREATHNKFVFYNRFKISCNKGTQRRFIFDSDLKPNFIISAQRYWYQSFTIRVISKIRNIIEI